MITKKGLDTRNKIIERSAELFNTNGYAGTSINDILQATNYSKGALYRIFPDKKSLAIDAFKLNLKKLQFEFRAFLNSKSTAKEKLFSIPDFYSRNRVDDLVRGGCPILNTSVESDDVDEVLSALVKEAFSDWAIVIENLIDQGIERGDFNAQIDSKAIAYFIIAAIEGSILLSKAYKEHNITQQNMEMLKAFLKTNLEKT